MKKSFRVLLTLAVLSFPPLARANSYGVFGSFREDFVFSPKFSHFMVCADVGCETRLTTGVFAEEEALLRELFISVSSPSQERRAIALALGRFELFVGRQDKIQTWDDREANTHFGKAVGSRQLDCFAESHNATTYLLVLIREGLLRFHSVDEISRRGFLLDQHYAARIVDRTTKAHYIVDSWFLANAAPAVILPYSDWKNKNEAPFVKAAKELAETRPHAVGRRR